VATAIGDLVIRLGAQTTQFGKKMRIAQGQLLAMGPTTARMGQVMAGGFATATVAARTLAASLLPIMGPLAGVAGFMGLVQSGEAFNRKMRQSLAIMDDVGESMRKNLRDTAFEVARATRFSATEAAEAYFFLFSAGLDAQRSLAALPRVAKFAQAGNFDLAKATELAAGAQAAMGLKSNDAKKHLENLTRVTDVLVKANKLAQATTEQFATALLNDAANAARMAGQSIEQVVAVLAAFAEKGVKGEEAGSAYARAINYLSIQAVENADAFEQAGVKMFDASDNTRKLVDVIEDLEKRFAGMSDKARTSELMILGFTKKTIALMNTLIGTSESIRHFEKQLLEAAGTVDKVSGDQLTPFQEGWKVLSSAVSDADAAFTSKMGPGLEVIQKFIAGLISDLHYLVGALDSVASAAIDFVIAPGATAGRAAVAVEEFFTGNAAEQNAKLARSQAMLDKQNALNANRDEQIKFQDALNAKEAERNAAEKETARLKRLNFTTTQAALSWEQSALSQVTTARERYNLTLRRINESTKLLTERQKELARDVAFRQLDADTGGAAAKLQDLTNQYRLLTGEVTKAGLALEKLDQAGDDPFAVEAVEKMQKALAGVNAKQELKRMGEAFESRFLTPLERAQKTAEQAKRLHGEGAISGETLRRAEAASGASTSTSTSTGGDSGSAGAFARGSREAWSSVMAAMNQRKKPMQDVVKNTKKTAEGIDEIVGLIQDQGSEFQEIPS